MESKEFYGSSSINKDKKKFLSKLTEEKKTKEKLKDLSKQALTIQKYYRRYHQILLSHASINKSLSSRLKDVTSLKTMLKKPDFKPPLPILIDFIRDLSYLCLSKSTIISYMSIIDDILAYIKLSLESDNPKENLLKAFLENITTKEYFYKKPELLKMKINDPRYYPIRLVITIKKCITLFIKLMSINLPRFPNAFNCLSFIFNVPSYKQLKTFDFIIPFYSRILQENTFYETFRKIIIQAMNPIKKLNKNEHMSITKLIDLPFFPLEFYSEYGGCNYFIDTNNFNYSYDNFMNNINDFILKILTIPRCSFFIQLLEKPSRIIFKPLFQGFLFHHFKDPMFDQIDQEFLKKFSKSKNDFIFFLGNSIEILDHLLKRPNFDINEHFALMKTINMTLGYVTPSWLKGLLGYQWIDDRDLWYLRGQFLLLLSQDFAANMFYQALELNNKSKSFSDKFNHHCAISLCQIYTNLIIICYRTEETQQSISRITNVLALQPELLRKVYIFMESYFGIQAYVDNKLDPEEIKKFLSVLIIYLMGYINILFVSDRDDFQEFLSKDLNKSIVKFIKGLILLISKRLWVIENLSDQEVSDEKILYDFIIVHGSKLLQLFYEFNQKVPFLDMKDWLVPEKTIQDLINEVLALKFIHMGLLMKLPFGFPFEYRLQILMTLLEEERNHHTEGFQLTIRRECLFEDGFQAFQAISKTSLKSRLRVFYIDEFGMEEKGVDGGGIFKEFLNDICKIVFDPSYGLFKITEQNQQLYPNPAAKFMLGGDYLEIYSFIGSLIGRALYDNILIGMMFSSFFLRRWLGKHNFLNELQSFDIELYNNLKFLKTYNGDVADLGLYFTIIDANDNNKEVELIPHGKTIPVDNSNKFRYIYLMANYKLNETTKLQTQAFLVGLQKVVPMNYLQFFDENELQMVLSGALNALDIEDLKRNVDLKGYSMNETYMKDFWKILQDLNEADRNLFVKFVTACERPPLLGFSKLVPKFTIQMISSEGDKKLPTSATCFNKLNLPKYSKKEILKEKLLLAIRSAKGFYLT